MAVGVATWLLGGGGGRGMHVCTHLRVPFVAVRGMVGVSGTPFPQAAALPPPLLPSCFGPPSHAARAVLLPPSPMLQSPLSRCVRCAALRPLAGHGGRHQQQRLAQPSSGGHGDEPDGHAGGHLVLLSFHGKKDESSLGVLYERRACNRCPLEPDGHAGGCFRSCFPVLLPLLVRLYKHCTWGDRVVEMSQMATQMG